MITRILRLLAAGALLAALASVPAVSVSAGGGCHAPDGAVHMDGATNVVRMDTCSFGPTVARVEVGTEVRFLNTATLPHVVTGERQSWGSGRALDPGEEVSHRFDQAGVFPYSCPLHPGMVGAIVVGEAPAAAAPAGGTTGVPPAIAPAAVLAVGLAGVIGGLALAGLLAARRRAAAAGPHSAQGDARIA